MQQIPAAFDKATSHIDYARLENKKGPPDLHQRPILLQHGSAV